MLNKGPYIGDAIATLDSILTRMHGHQDKKRSLLRQLSAWTPADVQRSNAGPKPVAASAPGDIVG